MMKSSQVISTLEFQNFLKSCRKYCNFLETNHKNDSDFLFELQNLLLKIYSDGLKLPTVALDSNIDFENKLDDKEFNIVKNQVSKLIGENQYYWTIFNPTENVFGNESPVMGDLLDDIMEIYKDIKYQLMIFDINTEESIESSVWEMKFDFWHHWGNHAIDALRTIHHLLERTEKYK